MRDGRRFTVSSVLRRLGLEASGIAGTLCISALAFAASLTPGAADWLEYQRDARGIALLARGISGHWVHIGWGHLGWNVLGFTVLGALCERGSRRSFALALALSSAAIPLALQLCEPEIARYCGLSGVVSALFGVLAVRATAAHARGGRRGVALATALVALGFVWRLGWIWIRGDLWLLESTGFALTPVPLSHAIGLAVGVGVGITEILRGSPPYSRCARARATFARFARRISLEELSRMSRSRSLRGAQSVLLAAVLLATLPGVARADGSPSGCAGSSSFWREAADVCAECAARLREAPPVQRALARSPRVFHSRASQPARAPGLVPVTAVAAGRSREALGRALDPVVDPVLRETTEAVGAVVGTALGAALYPPIKALEHVIGAAD